MNKKLTIAEVRSILKYNKTMLTCDMSINRDPEHQDVSPDYYGKDAEDLYYAIIFIEKYLDNSIPIEWIEKKITEYVISSRYSSDEVPIVYALLSDWRKENAGILQRD